MNINKIEKILIGIISISGLIGIIGAFAVKKSRSLVVFFISIIVILSVITFILSIGYITSAAWKTRSITDVHQHHSILRWTSVIGWLIISACIILLISIILILAGATTLSGGLALAEIGEIILSGTLRIPVILLCFLLISANVSVLIVSLLSVFNYRGSQEYTDDSSTYHEEMIKAVNALWMSIIFSGIIILLVISFIIFIVIAKSAGKTIQKKIQEKQNLIQSENLHRSSYGTMN